MLRFDWNSLLDSELKFVNYSKKMYPKADNLVRYLEDFADAELSKDNVKVNSTVHKIQRGNNEHNFIYRKTIQNFRRISTSCTKTI